MSYILHYDLGDFITQVDDTGPIYVQDYTETAFAHGVPTALNTVLTATYQDAEGRLHVARIVVEKVTMMGQLAAPVQAAVRDRMMQARAALVAALSDGTPVLGGILAEPGLMSDLALLHTSHDLWHLADAASRDPLDRMLVSLDGTPLEGAHP